MFGDQVFTGPIGEIILTPRSYLNVDSFVITVPCASIPFIYSVVVASRGEGLAISDPLFAQLTVEVEIKLSYE
jgi:hypothetical protein